MSMPSAEVEAMVEAVDAVAGTTLAKFFPELRRGDVPAELSDDYASALRDYVERGAAGELEPRSVGR